MKTLALIVLCAAALLSGCESMSERVQDRFTAATPHTRVFPAEMKGVYAAAQQAVKNVGLQLGRKSIGTGHIEAYAAINTGNPTQDSRQTSLDIRLTETEAGEIQVSLLVTEQTEGSFPGGVSQQPLKEHSLYELYFTALQQVLQENGDLKSAAKP
jgi:hypothetical protein